MPVEITMPQLSDTMSEGTVIKWIKKEGDAIKESEIIAEVETDKATMEWESTASGTLAKIVANEGEKVKVGETIAVIATAGENVEEIKKQFTGGAAKKAEAPKIQPAKPEASEEKPGGAEGASSHDTEIGRTPLETGRAQSRRESVQEGPERTSEQLSRQAVATMQKTRPNEKTGDQNENRLRISPLARRIARDKGIDPSQVMGSGPNGRVVQRDILEFDPAARSSAAEKKATPPLPSRVPSGQKEVTTLTKIRSVIANRLQQAKQNIPHFYETIDIDVEDLSSLRARLNDRLEDENVRLSLGDFIAKAIAAALHRHPGLNATFNGTEITRHGDVNLGMAVALPEGLIVPVLRNINQMGLREIRVRSVDLVERARSQKLRQDEMTGATFTVSNLGTHGVREFSAIINPPEVAILAIGAAEKRAVVRADRIVARTMMTITLSADHRVVDGAAAAEFLQTLKQLLEEPGMMLA